MYINHDPVMTLTKFMARSACVAHAFEWEKLLKCRLKGKASKKLANGQNIDYSEKRKRPKGFICPCTGVKYHNIQTCLLVYAADSGERLQDHWSSRLLIFSIYLKKSTVGFFKKLICYREISDRQVDNAKVHSYRIRFPAISVRR